MTQPGLETVTTALEFIELVLISFCFIRNSSLIWFITLSEQFPHELGSCGGDSARVLGVLSLCEGLISISDVVVLVA